MKLALLMKNCRVQSHSRKSPFCFAKCFHVVQRDGCQPWAAQRLCLVSLLRPDGQTGPFMVPKNRTCKVSLDGTNFMICELSPFSSQWFGHKHNGPVVRCEVAICLQTGWVAWISGPCAAGKWSDLKIFRDRLRQMLLPGEMVEADGTHNDPARRHLKRNRHVFVQGRRARHKSQARRETVSGFFKDFGCMKQVFCHEPWKHKVCFEAGAVTVQLGLESGRLRAFQKFQRCH